MNEILWTFIITYPVAYKSDEMLKDWIIKAMQSYHEAKLKEITDSDIEAWAKNYYQKADENEISCLIIGAKAALNNEIKHIKQHIEVYSRPECPFNYCDDPETCKKLDKCRHR